ncbi:tRNA uridine-5-carboxymethylaminomethyl(34) synthesis enzyme MnmG [Mycoplasmoides pirum]|uniref:tRNA uridine-5-carboxymethylaminomethyl(34) synthesis enzyme MnmG n=1 Tax=Mycoplasmoides pirum TaxID=2122 RepID=UPI0005672B07|nr:tRNA uridine-5-carboxymethylaminomethyl(34) synthesis enzyme MnmG [Mycoplasmoides pirum]
MKNKHSNKKPIVVVVGAGHAGLESAFSASKMGCYVYLIVLKKEYIANCPCNPSIGGPAKGIVTREIDALGGMQAIAADACQLQMKLLNSSKGPGVQALRAQIDKIKYHEWFLKKINNSKNIKLIEDEVTKIVVKNNKAIGVELSSRKIVKSDATILTTGTYMQSVTFQGKKQIAEGPSGFKRSQNLSENLKNLNFKLIRLKTGTPPRIDKDTIDYSSMNLELGSDGEYAFSFSTKKFVPLNKQLPCYLIHTNSKTHDIIKKNFKDSAMYSGQIQGIGPRYCPSIEDKVFKFSDKERHQIFLEPESLKLNTIYLGGFSTSFSNKIQNLLIKTLPGLEKCKIISYGYAIEYDAIDPLQLFPTLETKLIKNLYTAGQINGSSGYEEAAGQGIMAGINAALKLHNKKPFILKRDEAYIGVMIDDLVTKGVTEPYRLLTSRAEHRLLLRNDNAQKRLIDYGKKFGLISNKVYNEYLISKNKIKKAIEFLKKKKVGEFSFLKKKTNNTNFTLYQYLKRPEIKLKKLLSDLKIKNFKLTNLEINIIEIEIKYEGYIKNHLKSLKSIGNLQNVVIPANFNYKNILNLSNEAIDKLSKIQPLNLDQASRISGINFPDIVAIKTHLVKFSSRKNNKNGQQ